MNIPDFNFKCEYCGKEFGNEPQNVAVHIGRNHVDERRHSD